ncbi:MAG: succinyl-diaminopimelate desuccinylase [Gammaproteobacteria bacterium]|jgi:succinyl-diaminopimelate desuccinylase|nr:succinyl-diaminopimelate desuccinylase [Gammaproteobacteria bacterium]
MTPTVEFAIDLIERRSVTPDDCGCQQLMGAKLAAAGFDVEHIRIGEVDNLWARHGTASPVLCFAGHTDVVPPGPEDEWATPPFTATLQDGMLYGRGAADMKSALAAMVDAATDFVTAVPDHAGSIAFLITSDEEGPAQDGTKATIRKLLQRDIHIDWCVIGEPSSTAELGDAIKVGRRGSLSGMLTVHGVQGHVAYPHLADNPIQRFAPVLHELYQLRLDDGNAFFPPSSFQVVQLKSGTGFPNVTPPDLYTRFNFRYSTEWDHEGIKRKITGILDAHNLNYTLDWHLSGEPFLTEGGDLIPAVQAAVRAVTGRDPELSTSGGTSDGRFIAPAGAEVVEIGAVNKTIHKFNEEIRVADIDRLKAIYLHIATSLLPGGQR